MDFVLGKQGIRLVFTAYLALATFGTFIMASIAPLRSVDVSVDEPISSGFFTTINHTIDCLAEGSTGLNKSRGYAPLCYGQLRAALALGVHKDETAALFSRLKIIEKITYSHIKNTILLKLRI
ncbi:MAG: hypothetical protein LBP19_06155 [Treponema sp.]|nr:hypothetical protein [Treponema sp.]